MKPPRFAGGAQIGGIAAEDLGDAGQAQRLDVAADERARLGVLLDEQAEGGAARQRLEAERAGAGEQVEHLGALQREVGDAVREDVEHRLAHAVGGGPRARRRPARPAAGRGTGRRRSSCPALGLGRGRLARRPGASPRRPRCRARRPPARPSCSTQHAPLHRLDRARLQVEQLERPEGDADQPVHGQAEGFQDGAHLAVLALAQADREPHVGCPATLSSVASMGP